MTGRELWRRSRRRRDERGSTIPMIIGFALVLILLVGVVVDASAAYLRRQSLDTLADGAALRGADLGASGTWFFQGRETGQRVPLTTSSIDAVVRSYLRATGAYGRYPGLRYRVHVDSVSQTVDVELATHLDLPFSGPGISSTTVRARGSATVVRAHES